MKIIRLFAGVLLILSLMGCASETKVGLGVGMQAPEIKGESINGESVSLKELRGKPVILMFWQTISVPSQRELISLQQFQDRNKDSVQVVTINLGEENNVVTSFLEGNSIQLPVLIDDKKKTWANLYRIDLMPTTFILDDKGLVQAIEKNGLSTEDLESIVGKVLAK